MTHFHALFLDLSWWGGWWRGLPFNKNSNSQPNFDQTTEVTVRDVNYTAVNRHNAAKRLRVRLILFCVWENQQEVQLESFQMWCIVGKKVFFFQHIVRRGFTVTQSEAPNVLRRHVLSAKRGTQDCPFYVSRRDVKTSQNFFSLRKKQMRISEVEINETVGPRWR